MHGTLKLLQKRVAFFCSNYHTTSLDLYTAIRSILGKKGDSPETKWGNVVSELEKWNKKEINCPSKHQEILLRAYPLKSDSEETRQLKKIVSDTFQQNQKPSYIAPWK